jgi:hypothetical protein
MNHSPKTKVSGVRASLRRVAALALRPSFPAWIDAESGLAFSTTTLVTPRVRDCLVLRLVDGRKSHLLRNPSYAHGGR